MCTHEPTMGDLITRIVLRYAAVVEDGYDAIDAIAGVLMEEGFTVISSKRYVELCEDEQLLTDTLQSRAILNAVRADRAIPR